MIEYAFPRRRVRVTAETCRERTRLVRVRRDHSRQLSRLDDETGAAVHDRSRAWRARRRVRRRTLTRSGSMRSTEMTRPAATVARRPTSRGFHQRLDRQQEERGVRVVRDQVSR